MYTLKLIAHKMIFQKSKSNIFNIAYLIHTIYYIRTILQNFEKLVGSNYKYPTTFSK